MADEKYVGVGKGESIVVKERPIHDENQIRDVSELEIGVEYERIGGGGSSRFVYKCILPGLKTIKVLRGDREEELSLADLGIIPYEGGWNKHNYVVPVKRGGRE